MELNELQALLQSVREEKLPQHMLEKYRDAMIFFRTDIKIAVAELKKKRALSMLGSHEPTMAAKKLEWEASAEGQRLLQLTGYEQALGEEIAGLRDRIWSFLRQS